MVSDVDDQSQESINEILPRAGSTLQATLQQLTIESGKTHTNTAMKKRIPGVKKACWTVSQERFLGNDSLDAPHPHLVSILLKRLAGSVHTRLDAPGASKMVNASPICMVGTTGSAINLLWRSNGESRLSQMEAVTTRKPLKQGEI